MNFVMRRRGYALAKKICKEDKGMTREEAIKMLKSKMDGHTDTSYEWAETVRMAIEALSQEPCGDSVSRQAVISLFDGKLEEAYPAISKTINKCITVLPSVTPQAMPKMGHWITKDGQQHGFDIGGVKTWYIQIMCSECGFIKTAIEGHTGQYHYCPNCGAKMEESQGDKE